MAEYVQEMMFYGSRLRPVADVVAEAMEAEDAATVNHYITFLLAHAFDTGDIGLRRQCNNIRRAHGWHPFQGAPASDNNLPRRGPNEPDAMLRTPEADELWERLRQAGYIEDGSFRLAGGVSNNQAAYLADRMAERLNIRNKWKVFQQLWGIRNMAQLAGSWQQTGKLPPGNREIDKLLG